MQPQTTQITSDQALEQLKRAVRPDTVFYIVNVNRGLQVNLKHGSERGKNCTIGIHIAFGLPLKPNGLTCTAAEIISRLVEVLPQYDIRLLSEPPAQLAQSQQSAIPATPVQVNGDVDFESLTDAEKLEFVRSHSDMVYSNLEHKANQRRASRGKSE